jgi:competence protein ComEA
MVWLYRWQQYIRITTAEATTILTLTGLFLLGLGVRAWQQQATLPPLPAEATTAWAAASRALVTDQPIQATPPEEADAVSPASPEVAPVKTVERRATALRPIPRLNVNTATAAQLELLPRVGPKMAERIVAYRAAHGGFRRVQDLLAVKGIGEKTLALLEPHVFVE